MLETAELSRDGVPVTGVGLPHQGPPWRSRARDGDCPADDASFLPSSAALNPALTIAANALRVAPTIAGETATKVGDRAGDT